MMTAIKEPINPNLTWVFIKGFLINFLVAPTICIVLMFILLEYIESRIEPLITTIEIIRKNIAIPKIQYLILLILSLIKDTNGAS